MNNVGAENASERRGVFALQQIARTFHAYINILGTFYAN